MLSEKIRFWWKDFREDKSRNHQELTPASLVPFKDKTSLFTVAGMQQLVPYLSGKEHPQWKRLFDIQKCIRTLDIDEIGDERHLTMFEMMGNWSLWDYAKEDSITWSVEFLTKVCNIPLEKLGATIYSWDEKLNLSEDLQARKILNEAWIPDSRIRPMQENWRWPAWEVWPCGPDCEFYYDRGENFGPSDWLMDENDRYTEIWNNVFMEFYKDQDWNFTQLPQNNVDTWMWLERLVMILQNKETIFETDLFSWLIENIEKFTNFKYPPYSKKENTFSQKEHEITRRFRIITDHFRASFFLVADGVLPSNEWRWYVLRRLIRRAYYNLYLLNDKFDHVNFLQSIYQVLGKKYWTFRTNITNNSSLVDIISNEISKFKNTIQKWIKLFDDFAKTIENETISGEICFKLYDTFGFPLELTKEIWQNQNLKIDEKWFFELMEQAKQKSKNASKDNFKRWENRAKYIEWIEPTQFVWYDNLYLEDAKVLKKFELDGQQIYIFDKTPFYAESWGQTADKWQIELDNGQILEIKDVQSIAGVYLHFVK